MHALANSVLEGLIWSVSFQPSIHGVFAGWHLTSIIPSVLRVVAELTAGVLVIRPRSGPARPSAFEVRPQCTTLACELGH